MALKIKIIIYSLLALSVVYSLSGVIISSDPEDVERSQLIEGVVSGATCKTVVGRVTQTKYVFEFQDTRKCQVFFPFPECYDDKILEDFKGRKFKGYFLGLEPLEINIERYEVFSFETGRWNNNVLRLVLAGLLTFFILLTNRLFLVFEGRKISH